LFISYHFVDLFPSRWQRIRWKPARCLQTDGESGGRTSRHLPEKPYILSLFNQNI